LFAKKGSRNLINATSSIEGSNTEPEFPKFPEKKLTGQYNDKPIILNSYSSIYKQQRDNSKQSNEIVSSDRYKEKDVNHIPMRPHLSHSNSLGDQSFLKSASQSANNKHS
jgi:hypothetical protein